ncbi:hypothetical protein [Herbiconiux sp. UC225_62]|uniref:hypothetical protein n=1 Tax=Herbiconiux sp. UC225_62 TaxID=3350168 RepID=UPI0036D2277F
MSGIPLLAPGRGLHPDVSLVSRARRTVGMAPTGWGGWAAHGVMVAGMVAVVIAPGTMLPVAVGLLVTATTLARSARAQVWARQAIVDLWAMAFLTVSAVASASHGAGPAPASASAPTSHHAGAPTTAFEFLLSPVVVLAAWMLARTILVVVARRAGSIRHSLLTAAAAAAQLLVMLTLH